MPKRIKLRTLTSEEEQEIRRLAKSRKEPARLSNAPKSLVQCWTIQGLPLLEPVKERGFGVRR